jgi:hypothetical protein
MRPVIELTAEECAQAAREYVERNYFRVYKRPAAHKVTGVRFTTASGSLAGASVIIDATPEAKQP